MLVSDYDTRGVLDIGRLGACFVKDATYKTVNGQELQASIVVPQCLVPGKHPIVVRWHGGGLVNGHRLYTPWIARYMINFSHTSQAIMVLPDYRLLPGASGLDILEDLKDFFAWMFDDGLDQHLDQGISADLDDVVVSGESAGGWLAIQSALTQKPTRIKAVIAHYPMIDMRDSHWTVPDSSKYLGGAPLTDSKDIAEFFGPQERMTTSRMPPDGGEIYHCLVRQGLYGEVFGKSKSLYPLELIEDIRSFPPLWIIHGSEDTIVPPSGTIKFAERLRERAPARLHLTIRPGEEHLFDVDTEADQDWTRLGLKFVEKFWPSKGPC